MTRPNRQEEEEGEKEEKDEEKEEEEDLTQLTFSPRLERERKQEIHVSHTHVYTDTKISIAAPKKQMIGEESSHSSLHIYLYTSF